MPRWSVRHRPLPLRPERLPPPPRPQRFGARNRRHRIPFGLEQAIAAGWPEALGHRPRGVTWHWTATDDLATCRDLLGGTDAARRGLASAHYGVGRSFGEGVDRYVGLEARSFHAGTGQRLRWNGDRYRGADDKGARTTIGVEVVHIGYARRGVPAGPDWLTVDDPTGRTMRVAPWPVEQLTMCVAVGREIVRRFPAIGPRDHHGHDDLCPGFKQDPSHAFPYARLLRAIYRDPSLPDVWSPLRTRAARRRVLRRLGHGLPWPADEDVARPWGPDDVDALERFQTTAGLTVDGCWTSFVSWRVHDVLGEDGLAAAVRPPARVVRRPAPDRSSPARPTRSADAPSPPAPD